MIRAAKPSDIPAVLDLVVAAGMFDREEVGMVADLLGQYFAGAADQGHGFVVDTEDDLVVGVAYHQPKPADRVVDLTMIAVDPGLQGRGRGTGLLRHVEDRLRADRQRLLLVETSGTAQYDLTREFYAKCGYDQEARVRDYWTDGDDMVLFRKVLQ